MGCDKRCKKSWWYGVLYFYVNIYIIEDERLLDIAFVAHENCK